MNSKTILGILLLLSMIFVLYPSVTSLIDIQKSISDSRYLSSEALKELVKARDNLILQIMGFVFLYIVLAFGFNFIKFTEQQNTSMSIEPQESKPTKSQQIIEPKPPKIVKPLTNKTKNVIAVLSSSVFMLVFVWQVFSNIPNTTMNFDVTTFFLEQAMKGIIACLVVGIIAYSVAKYH